jgi:hypothetical protein
MTISFAFLELHYDLLLGIIGCLKEQKKKQKYFCSSMIWNSQIGLSFGLNCEGCFNF